MAGIASITALFTLLGAVAAQSSKAPSAAYSAP